jgi:Tol biopolymer transport system component/predicted Ser/Thr protein kinase
MKPERWQQISTLFQAALQREPAQQAIFLDEACAGDSSLRTEVESLIASHEQVGNFIEAPAIEVAAPLLVDDQADSVVGRMIGRYRILGPLGEGGMGEVYLAQDTRLGRQIAIKLLPAHLTRNKDRLSRFEQEAHSASTLSHPNVCIIHEIGETEDDRHFIAMEFVDGVTLRRHMIDTQMKLGEVLDVAAQIASALAAAHEAGIVHRDIKPENIMIRCDGYVKVLDFGLAKLTEGRAFTIDAEAATRALVKSNPGIVMGTLTYMSPEQARGIAVDARSDIFSLGVVLYEMIAGRAPFDRPTTSDVIAAILKDEPEPLVAYAPETPKELERIVWKALAKDWNDRYQSVTDLSGDLKRLKEEGEVKRFRRSAVFRFVALLLVLAVIAVLSVFFLRRGEEAAARSSPTTRGITFRLGFITAARFAPDGKTVIYSGGFDGQPTELFSTRLEGPESRSLGLRNAGIKSVSSKGEMAVLLDPELSWGETRNGTLARVPLAGGTPQTLMEQVDEADWAPDGETLAIVRVLEGEHRLEYPMGEVLYKAPGWISHMRVSPKGDRIAFLDHPVLGDQGGSVAVVDLNTKNTSLVSTGWRAMLGLAWSPAGDEIWFSGSRVNRKEALYAVTLSGRERLLYEAPAHLRLQDVSAAGRVLVNRGSGGNSHMMYLSAISRMERDLKAFDWSTSADLSADGQTLLFYEWGNAVDGIPSVYIRKTDGSEAVRLGQGRALALSPDGKWALAVQETSPPQLVLLPTGPGELRALQNHGAKEYYYASWFPDGRQILFTAKESGSDLRSYVQDTESGEARPLTDEGIVALRVSPDGNRVVAFNNFEGKYYLYPLDGTDPTLIRGLEADEEPIQWSADGLTLYVRGLGDFATKVYRVQLASGRRTLWKEITPADPVGNIGLEAKPGGILITPDGESYVYTYWTLFHELNLLDGLK